MNSVRLKVRTKQNISGMPAKNTCVASGQACYAESWLLLVFHGSVCLGIWLNIADVSEMMFLVEINILIRRMRKEECCSSVV